MMQSPTIDPAIVGSYIKENAPVAVNYIKENAPAAVSYITENVDLPAVINTIRENVDLDLVNGWVQLISKVAKSATSEEPVAPAAPVLEGAPVSPFRTWPPAPVQAFIPQTTPPTTTPDTPIITPPSADLLGALARKGISLIPAGEEEDFDAEETKRLLARLMAQTRALFKDKSPEEIEAFLQ